LAFARFLEQVLHDGLIADGWEGTVAKREAGRYVYACVFKPRDPQPQASYALSIQTIPLRGLRHLDAG
jgi:hypothetical protein